MLRGLYYSVAFCAKKKSTQGLKTSGLAGGGAVEVLRWRCCGKGAGRGAR